MTAITTPILPFYAVYVLQSTVSRASLYIGSTTHPPRRLKQHNGQVKGGAKRTARPTKRPWEMVSLVSGFPGLISALQFEWALNNPHRSLHIPSESRITVVAKKRPWRHRRKRPAHTTKSVYSNLHLLLRVPSFTRWPLKLHFFATEAHKMWTQCSKAAGEPLRASIPVYTDFPPSLTVAGASAEPWGIHALPLNYEPIKDFVEKTRALYAADIKDGCAFCGEDLVRGEGIYTTCSNAGCDATGHMSCWSRHLLGRNLHEEIIPISGRCPRCKGEVGWGDLMKETSLRIRGQKVVDKLLKKKKSTSKKASKVEENGELAKKTVTRRRKSVEADKDVEEVDEPGTKKRTARSKSPEKEVDGSVKKKATRRKSVETDEEVEEADKPVTKKTTSRKSPEKEADEPVKKKKTTTRRSKSPQTEEEREVDKPLRKRTRSKSPALKGSL